MRTHADARRLLAERGAAALPVDDLTTADLRDIAWSGSPSHIRSVGVLLDRRARSGDVDYLCIRTSEGHPVAKCCVDYTGSVAFAGEYAGAPEITQLATHESLQGLGLATHLIAAAEERIRGRGRNVALLGVEDDNPRARALYERLGYVACGRERVSWEHDDEHGERTLYETEITILRKTL